MKLLANPIFIRMAGGLLLAVAAFLAAIVVSRILRRRIVDDALSSDGPGQENTLYPYSVVIQQLKQQKFELQNEQQIQRRRAKTSEQITTAVLANLPCGILFVAPNGLVKQANAAARRILGFASPLGMGLDELFRDAEGIFESGHSERVTDIFKIALRGQVEPPFEARYYNASGIELTLAFALIPLNMPSGDSAGVAAVITDESSAADSRRDHVLQREISAEIALELRNSLASIRQSASQLGAASSPQSIANFATDISSETERLERLVGGFLAGKENAKSYVAGA